MHDWSLRNFSRELKVLGGLVPNLRPRNRTEIGTSLPFPKIPSHLTSVLAIPIGFMIERTAKAFACVQSGKIPHGIRKRSGVSKSLSLSRGKFRHKSQGIRKANFETHITKDFDEFPIWSLAFSRRLSSFLLEGNGIDVRWLGIGALTGATTGSKELDKLEVDYSGVDKLVLDCFEGEEIQEVEFDLRPSEYRDIGRDSVGDGGDGGLEGFSRGVIGDSERVISNEGMLWRGSLGKEEVVVGEGVVVTSSSLEMLTNNCPGWIMVSLIFLEGLDEEALVEFIVE
ncbi:hypothetical protein Tco_0600418 [Tanacetum coccineum]|uniref:Uncharacterized protein n=1 Tax=Tanacetum coccineum TaxID=301880 RepID=A0ABQ4WBP5_9ASTR